MLGLPGDIYDTYDKIFRTLSCLQHLCSDSSASQSSQDLGHLALGDLILSITITRKSSLPWLSLMVPLIGPY